MMQSCNKTNSRVTPSDSVNFKRAKTTDDHVEILRGVDLQRLNEKEREHAPELLREVHVFCIGQMTLENVTE